MMQCSKEQFWDGLLGNCVSCMSACQPLKFKRCTDVCSSLECTKQEGSYYDKLLRECIKCSSICGQHPVECVPFCRETLATNLPTPAALQPLQRKLDAVYDQQMVVYVTLGLSLCILLFFLLLTWIYFRKKRDETPCRARPEACHKKGDQPKDCLMETGSLRSESGDSQTPEPVETCGFCFPEVSPAVQETRASPRTYQLEMLADAAAVRGPIPTSEDCHFQIICSPSQEKMQVT